MNQLKITSLLLVGNSEEKKYFENYFNNVELVNSNNEALTIYTKNIFSVIFLNSISNQNNAFDICEKIREHDNKTVLALLTDKLNEERLYKALPLHLSGCIIKPFQQYQVEEVLSHVKHDLEFLSENTVRLLNGYHFHTRQKILHNDLHNEIKLTKNEFRLLNMLIKAKDEIVIEESIEHEIWEEDSFEIDCSSRLKNLLYNLRKKLPKKSITNNYKLGYRLIHAQ